MSVVINDQTLLKEAEALRARAEEYVRLERQADKLRFDVGAKDEPKKSQLRELERKIDQLKPDADRFLKLHSEYHEKLRVEPEWDGRRYRPKAGTIECDLCPGRKNKKQ